MPPGNGHNSPSGLRATAAEWNGSSSSNEERSRFTSIFVTPSGAAFAFNYTAMNTPPTPTHDMQPLPDYDNVFRPVHP
eukprot:CAMPEP_0182471672 /NCGR_PEP_ID=MMETSP1319-20130603/20778_1 /TAXON_ID=172717 /ORGANISM="Bolidomonas pacifica, Strain RCC208" /LENGTH=77 /DNA_ID=CAMNT_0024672249 /DNA_START=10 /DNA_END=243 /DNA_ORIENTATION=+